MNFLHAFEHYSNCKRQDYLATDDTDKTRMPSKIANESVGQKTFCFLCKLSVKIRVIRGKKLYHLQFENISGTEPQLP